MANVWDALNRSAEGFIKTYTANENAKNKLKSEMMIAKMRAQQDQAFKEQAMQTKGKFDLDLAKEKARVPFEMYKEYQNTFGPPGPDLPPGSTLRAGPMTYRGPARIKPGGQKPYDPKITEQVIGKFTDPNKSSEDFKADLEDLKANKALYEQAGVDVGEVFNQALMRKDVAPDKKSWLQKIAAAWNQ